jgi:lysozyme
MRITKGSQNLINLIAKFEGLKLEAYKCPAGIATIGYGSTYYSDGSRVKMGDKITKEQAVRLLYDTLGTYEKFVDANTRDDISQNQFDALVDFAYNCGNGNLKNSTLLKKVNANPNDATISAEFMKWTRANGKVLKGLVNRRVAEVELYFKK